MIFYIDVEHMSKLGCVHVFHLIFN